MSFISNPAVDSVSGAMRNFDTNPVTQQAFTNPVINVSSFTGDETQYIDMAGSRRDAMQIVLSGTATIKVYGTLQDDGTAPADCEYDDITSDVFGDASYTASGIHFDTVGKLACCKYVKVEAASCTSATLKVFIRKLY